MRRRPAPGRPRARSAPPQAAERLQKLLAHAGLASRREVEDWIRAGRLSVNGVAATLGTRAAPGDDVRLDGRPVRVRAARAAAHVFLCHRSPGEALADAIARLPRRAGKRFIAVSPMPRVDGGLEIVTSDGALALRLQRGVHALVSEFSVRVRGELAEAQRAAVLRGELDSGVALEVQRLEAAGGEGTNRWYALAVRGASGKEVRQLLERQGALVSRVLRTGLGPVALGRVLGRGQSRELAAEEVAALLAAPAAALAQAAASG